MKHCPLSGWRWGRQHSGYLNGLESAPAMRTIAKRLITALATPTQGDKLPPLDGELFAFSIIQLEIAFDAQRPIVSDGDFHRHSNLSSLRIAAQVDDDAVR